MPPFDRLRALRDSTTLTGIDFVFVDPASQTTLRVHLVNTLAPPLSLSPGQVSITPQQEGADVPPVMVKTVSTTGNVIEVTTDRPGGFALYVLRLDDPRVDPYCGSAVISFKAGCETGLDCRPPPANCPPEAPVDFPVDYEARDFGSFRRALMDFAAQRYPRWPDRLEADALVMMAELVSAVGDEHSYYQDRIAREAYLDTATQRRSLRRHARLIDYPMHDGRGATTWLAVTVASGSSSVKVPAGHPVLGTRDGSTIVFEVGTGLAERFPTKPDYTALRALNALAPHIWDSKDSCLLVGSTTMTLAGDQVTALKSNTPPPGESWSRWVMLRTAPAEASVPARAVPVRLVAASADTDPLQGVAVTRIAWDPAQALVHPLDLETVSVLGNLVPATAGRTVATDEAGAPLRFSTGDLAGDDPPPRAVERDGPLAAPAPGDEEAPEPTRSTTYLFSLPGSDAEDLVWLGPDPAHATPEIRLAELDPHQPNVELRIWDWRPSFVSAASSLATSTHFMLDDGIFKPVFHDRSGRAFLDYAGGRGSTIRFGNGVFGLQPPAGSLFAVQYRLGNGSAGNVPPETLTTPDPPIPGLASVTNPLAVTDGEDAETAELVRLLAPDAFGNDPLRAVREEDYARAVERLPWVQRAGARFLWTGSWLAAYATPDPRGAVTLSAAQSHEVDEQLDRFRQAGRPAYGLDPVYADLDLEITVCVAPFAFPSDVVTGVLAALTGPSGFFAPDRFTFGVPLGRAELEARVQGVPGVRAVEELRLRRRGWFDWRPFTELLFAVAPQEVIRVTQDPLHPGRGSVTVKPRGGL